MNSNPSDPVTNVDLTTAIAEKFTPVVGQMFEVVFTDGRLPLTLTKVQPLGSTQIAGVRAPFALAFSGRAGLRLPQRIYRLEHPTFGALEIFLVQISGDAKESTFEAIFN